MVFRGLLLNCFEGLFLFGANLLQASRHRIVAASAPRIAPKNAPHSEGEALYRAMFHYCLPCIFRACGHETARGRGVWRYETLIEQYRTCQQPYKGFGYDMYDFHVFSPPILPSVVSCRSAFALLYAPASCALYDLSLSKSAVCRLYTRKQRATSFRALIPKRP